MGGKTLAIDLGPAAEGVRTGDSIAVNGVCLTVSSIDSSAASFDISSETLRRSTLGDLRISSRVNLERAVRADGRLGGHIVQGHIDGMGRIRNIRRMDPFAEFQIEAPAELLDQMVEKDSVAADGISLTIASLDSQTFTVALIPATLQNTTWQFSKVGDSVNLETDVLMKMVLKKLSAVRGKLTIENLKESGY